MNLDYKLARLKRIIKKYPSCVVAFSGGVDSTFLLKVASLVLPKDKILAVTATSATYPKEELIFAKTMARKIGVRHKIIRTAEVKDKRFSSNPINRCYICKKELFNKLKIIAGNFKFGYVMDASNVSDKNDFRPGSIALNELRICSPLKDAGLTKDDIRLLSKRIGLATWDKPSLACLASRIPYGIKITPSLLKRIDDAESYLRKLGFKQVRLRHYRNLCRIEVAQNEINRLLGCRREIVRRFKRLGYNYVTVDLEGYRTGSINPAFFVRKLNRI